MPKDTTDILSDGRVVSLDAKSEQDAKGKRKTYYIGQTAKELRKEIVKRHYKAICTAFKIPEKDLALFEQAAEGSGNEWMEINQLNSSTLLAFLCFHNVSQKQKFKFDGDEYSEVYFEVQSPLEPWNGRATAPSNMDVVLLTEDHGKALFLESKFTEYLSSKNPEVSSYYSGPYEALFGKDLTVNCSTEKEDLSFSIKGTKWDSENKGLYLEGLKQLVSHYLGISYCSREKDIDKFTGRSSLWKEISRAREIKLGSILYEFKNDKFRRYRAIYKALAEKICARTQGKIKIIDDIITYQKIIATDNKSLLDNKVTEFYFPSII